MRQNSENWRSSSWRGDEGRERGRGRNRSEHETSAQRDFNRYNDDDDFDYRQDRNGGSGYSQGYRGRESQMGIGNESFQGDRSNWGGGYGSSYDRGMGGQYSQGDYGNRGRMNEGYNQDYGRSGNYSSDYGYGNRDYERGDYGSMGMGGRYGQSHYMGNYGNSGSSSGNYGQQGRDWNSGRGSYGQGGNYGQSGNYGQGSNYGQSGNYGQQQDRGWWDKTRDEMSSWFGDDDAERRRRMDRMESHRGKGPKNYQRSEERIREDISDRLSDDDSLDASDIEIKVNGSEVTLSGTVETRAAKRRAEDIAEAVSGVSNVQNQLRVGSTASMGTGQSSSTQSSSSAQGTSSKTKTGSYENNNIKEKAHS